MFQALFKKVNTFYERVFYSYGNFLAKHYVAVIAVAFVLNICLSLGSFRMKMVTDSDELFVPMNGEAKADEALIKKLFSKVRNSKGKKISLKLTDKFFNLPNFFIFYFFVFYYSIIHFLLFHFFNFLFSSIF